MLLNDELNPMRSENGRNMITGMGCGAEHQFHLKRYRILPNPKFFKAPIDVFTIHGFIYFMYRRIFQSDGMQLNPI
jgi:hypothetical protein